jgi:hypothetical protein
MRSAGAAAILVALGVAACGGSRAQVEREQQPFDCRDRSISYVAAHDLGADELGVQMDCKDGPAIKRWKMDKAGHRTEDNQPLTPSQFNDVWTQIDATGWPNLHDCANGTAGKEDPLFTFDVKDDQNRASFTCQSREMPYPYNDLVDPLDQLAARKGQLGDDEPADAKGLDKKKPKQ